MTQNGRPRTESGQGLLFQDDHPEGFVFRPDFLSEAEERDVLEKIGRLPFGDVRMHGVIARRRVAQFGWHYTFDAASLEKGREVPSFLEPLRQRAAGLAGVEAGDLAEALVTEYPPGAPIGWHRDAPTFGIVVGISLLSACRFLLRRGPGGPKLELALPPRSAYVLAGAARRGWQHHIPPVKALRYSITFRTLRRRG